MSNDDVNPRSDEGSRTPKVQSSLRVFLFTDIVGSTSLKDRLGSSVYRIRLFTRHNELFESGLAEFPGAKIIDRTGDGYFASFETPSDAVRFALIFQSRMKLEAWEPEPIATRVGIHVGQVEIAQQGGQEYVVGLAADLTARVMSLAVGGQILLSRAAFDDARQYVRENPAAGVGSTSLKWLAHGPYLFQGSNDPLEVFEVGIEGFSPLRLPPDAEKARRIVRHDEEPVLGWRPALGECVPGKKKFVFTKKLGEGGFGEVWLGEHETLRDKRVFKFCFNVDRVRSLKREYTLFRLIKVSLGDRPDIARLFDYNFEASPFFLESEYTAGGDLTEWAFAQGGIGQLSLDQRLELLAKVADAVAAAHSVGILHKDIKPANILIHVNKDGTIQPRLADFGIGFIADSAQLQQHNIIATGFTQITEMNEGGSSRTGTRLYAPPESATDKPFTIQGDLYALGVILYQFVVADLSRPLATGWERDVPDPILRQDITDLVEGDVSRRLASAHIAAERLRSVLNRQQELERQRLLAERGARSRRRRHVMKLGVAGLLLVVFVGGMGAYKYVRDVKAEQKRTEGALEDLRQAQQQRSADRSRSAPAVLSAARSMINQGSIEAARVSVDLAMEYSPSDEALLMRASLEIQRSDYQSAARTLASIHSPEPEVADLSNALNRAAIDGPQMAANDLGDAFKRIGLYSFADAQYSAAGRLMDAYRARIEAAWPGMGKKLVSEYQGDLKLDLSGRSDVVNLLPLKGIPLTRLSIQEIPATDLTPLIGMPLNSIEAGKTQISDLTPLARMNLKRLGIGPSKVEDLSPLKNVPLVDLSIGFTQVTDLSPLRGMPLETLDLRSLTKLSDLSPLKGAPLKYINLDRTAVIDLSPLAGMKLESISLTFNATNDLSPLRGMKLQHVWISHSYVRDISALAGAPIKDLYMTNSRVADVSVLHDMPLERLVFAPQYVVKGLNELRGKPGLKYIANSQGLSDQTADEFWKRLDAGQFKTAADVGERIMGLQTPGSPPPSTAPAR